MVNEESLLGLALDSTGDPLAVVGARSESLEDEKIQGTLEQSYSFPFIIGSGCVFVSGCHPTRVWLDLGSDVNPRSLDKFVANRLIPEVERRLPEMEVA